MLHKPNHLHSWCLFILCFVFLEQETFCWVEAPATICWYFYNSKAIFLNWMLVTEQCGDAGDLQCGLYFYKTINNMTLKLENLRSGSKDSNIFLIANSAQSLASFQECCRFAPFISLVLFCLEPQSWAPGRDLGLHWPLHLNATLTVLLWKAPCPLWLALLTRAHSSEAWAFLRPKNTKWISVFALEKAMRVNFHRHVRVFGGGIL